MRRKRKMNFFQKTFIFTKMFVICVKTKIYHVMMLKKKS